MFNVENLALLRKELVANGLDGYIIWTTDPHDSEYAADYFLSERLFFCPFSGSAGHVLITRDEAFLWTDGRYWIQAEKQLEGSTISLMKFGDPKTPSLLDFIKEKKLSKVATNFMMISKNTLDRFANKGINLVDKDFSHLVKDRPALSKEKIFKLDEALFSQTSKEKMAEILEKTKKAGAEAVIITTLDDIAWTLNYRGKDIPCNPVFYAYLYISEEGNFLFMNLNKIDGIVEGVTVMPYERVFEFLKARQNVPTLVDFARANAKICAQLSKTVNGRSPSYMMKAIKKEVEIENTKKIQAIDGLALVKFWKYLEENLENNLSEYDYSEKLKEFRLSNPLCFDLSFDTIAAIGANAAQMHYEPTKEIHSLVTKDDMELLVDSGGQYFGGTTDTTRMFNIGKLSEEYMHDYTLTLKSVICLTKTIFLEGVSGRTIDMRARQFMWDEGMDYKCGTGHGVGYILNVHEGPNGFRPKGRPGVDDGDAIVPGMITTVEPGVYKVGKYGIRIENNLVCVDAFETTDGKFYKFETITYAPIDTRGLVLDMLDEAEIEWLNSYHQEVYDRLSKLTDDKELLVFLKEKTKPIKK